MLAVDSGIGTAVYEIGPQTQDDWIGQYTEPVVVETLQETNSFEATWDQIDLAMDEILDGEVSGYYATVTTLEESDFYFAMLVGLPAMNADALPLESENDQSATQSSSGDPNPLILSQCILTDLSSANNSCGVYYRAMPPNFGWNYSNTDPFVVMQSGSGTASILAWTHPCYSNSRITYEILDDPDDCWNKTSSTGIWPYQDIFTWQLPVGMTNSEVERDYQFQVTVTYLGQSTSCVIDVHIAYAEVLVDFAGAGNYQHVTTTGGQTAANTVIVGQKVSAKVESSLMVSNIAWFPTSGGNVVKNYTTNSNLGQAAYLAQTDYSSNVLNFYYTHYLMFNKIGGVSASIILTDTNGKIYVYAAGVSYYVDTPTAIISSTSQTDSNVINDVLIYGSVGSNNTEIPGIVFNATVTPPTYNGAGSVTFVETVIAQKDRYSANLASHTNQEQSSHGATFLVRSFPYTASASELPPETWNISSAPVSINTTARPGIALEDPNLY